MFRLDADPRVYLHREPIDFRAGITRLAVLIQAIPPDRIPAQGSWKG